jgi:hypothetical protein
MKIVYFHDRLLRNIYKCAQVRHRLQRYVRTTPVDAILVSIGSTSKGIQAMNLCGIRQGLPIHLSTHPLPFETMKLYEDSLHIDGTVFKPVDGTILYIDTEPTPHATTIFLDLFSDEEFGDYHSDLSDDQLQDLNQELRKKSKNN